jgi:hypothetical protein
MLIATSTANNIFSQFGIVSTSVFSSASAWLYLIAGLFVAWFMIESIQLIFFSDYPRRAKELRKKGVKSDLF